ncbi:MAG: cytochrome P450 [Actinobacteria bacterium]|nr:cytochrome P450 [Actinomycetota bacterium]
MNPVESASAPLRYDPLTADADPYPIFARLRTEDPVHYIPERELWVLSRFADVQAASRDPQLFSSADGVDLDENTELYAPGAVVDHDPPSHKRLRAVLREDFTPRKVKTREAATNERVGGLIDRFLESGGGNFVEFVARPLPVWLLCDLLGFPIEDHPELDRLYEGLQARTPGELELPQEAWDARAAMAVYVEDAVRERQAKPQDDLLTSLVRGEQSGELSREELVSLCLFMFFAGINTTIGLLSYGAYWLTEFPEQRALLAREPERIPAGVEEMLRFDAPVQWTKRTTTSQVELHGVTIPAGGAVLLAWGAAGRDEARWDRPEELDVDREPKRHLAFGEGIHHCIGAPYARLEAKLVFEHLLKRAPEYEVAGEVERLLTPGERILSSLPLAV